MMNEESLALRGVVTASLDWVVTPWTAPGVDRENDFAVVIGPDGDLAGYVFVESHPPYTEVFSVGVVAVRHHGRGVGAAVLEEAERRARRFFPLAPPGERIVMHAGALADEPRVAGLLTAHGFARGAPVRSHGDRVRRSARGSARDPGNRDPAPDRGGGADRLRLPDRGVCGSLGRHLAGRGRVAPRPRRGEHGVRPRPVAPRVARPGGRRHPDRLPRGGRRRQPGPRLEPRRPPGVPPPRHRRGPPSHELRAVPRPRVPRRRPRGRHRVRHRRDAGSTNGWA